MPFYQKYLKSSRLFLCLTTTQMRIHFKSYYAYNVHFIQQKIEMNVDIPVHSCNPFPCMCSSSIDCCWCNCSNHNGIPVGNVCTKSPSTNYIFMYFGNENLISTNSFIISDIGQG